MSEENVEIVREFIECWQRLDWERVADLVDPAVEQLGSVGGIEEGHVFRGLNAIRRYRESVHETWAEHHIEVERLIEAGERVVMFHREYHRGRVSGVELEIAPAVVFDLRDGRIVRFQGYMDRAAAARAAGLPDHGPASPTKSAAT